jgi:hypothetical protein
MKYLDPNGLDEYLFTWLPTKKSVGHSAVGWDNRDAKGNLTGTVTTRDHWQDKDGGYQSRTMAAKDIGTFPGGAADSGATEHRSPDGIIRIKGDAAQDKRFADAAKSVSGGYDPRNANCADLSKAAVQAIGVTAVPQSVVTAGPFVFAATTPVGVADAVADSGDDRVDVEKDLPADKKDPNMTVTRQQK